MNKKKPNHAVRALCDHLGGLTATARAMGISHPTVAQWASGRRPVPARRALELERLSGGMFKAELLAPHFPWKELGR